MSDDTGKIIIIPSDKEMIASLTAENLALKAELLELREYKESHENARPMTSLE